MALPQVAQSQLLSDEFAAALERYRPGSVAVLGCAGGNGFERVDTAVTRRVVGIDINPDYLDQARARFAERLHTLELFAGDLQTETFALAPVNLVFAGLLFEYVEMRATLARVASMLCPGGWLVSVLQLPSALVAEVTPSPYGSLEALSSIMRLVPPKQLSQAAADLGFRRADAHVAQSAGGKRFHIESFSLGDPT